MEINKKKYKGVYVETMNQNTDVISSVDHVFSSLPLRLFQSHEMLSKLENPTVLLWDLTIPNIKKYRSELCIDTGIFSSREAKYMLYEPDKYYFSSKVLNPDFKSLKENSLKVLKEYLLIRDLEVQSKILNRIEVLQRLFPVCHLENASQYFIELLKNIYLSLDLTSQYELIKKTMISVYHSNMINNFITQILKLTDGEIFGYKNLLQNTELFKPPYFRKLKVNLQTDIDFSSKNDIINKFDEVIMLLERKEIAPSNQGFFWAWSLAGIKHFGNDFGFLKEIEESFKSLGITNEIAKLQITEPKKDGQGFIEFENVLSYSPVLSSNVKIKFALSKTKPSRVSNFNDIYLHIGKENFKNYWTEFITNGSIQKVRMGEIK